jgi:gamma-glutamyltranspeptidase / glutathione hydrolase
MSRSSIVTRHGMAATSHPLATRAAVRMLEAGGNACDAAVAAAAVLCICEPMSTGIGGDCFAIVHGPEGLTGLNSSGRAPASADPEALDEVPVFGPQSVTVPGAVAGWQALLERHGRMGLDRCLSEAIDAGETGFAATPVIARAWARPETPLLDEAARLYLPAPEAGEVVRMPEYAATLRRIAEEGPHAFYEGTVADAICAASWLEPDDLASHRAEWVEPLVHGQIAELPPNGQGAIALQAIAIADGFDVVDTPVADRVHLQVEAMKLAFADGYRYIADEPLPSGYLDPAYIAERRAMIDPARAAFPEPGALPRGGTVYLCVVDADRMACSFIQSLYYGFGSGVAAPGTGVVLQNRGACFTLEPGHPNRLAAGKRPFHTIIPGMLLRPDGALLGPFGVMGGHVQPQGHLQVATSILRFGLDPQAALDAPRWRLDRDAEGWLLCLEPALWDVADDLERRGHRIWRDPDPASYGGGQIILVDGESLWGGSEPRKDGQAAGY